MRYKTGNREGMKRECKVNEREKKGKGDVERKRGRALCRCVLMSVDVCLK